MGSVDWRGWSGLAMVSVVLGVSAAGAQAAHFNGAPYAYTKSGVGPFVWSIATDDPGGANGSYAWKFASDSLWHRCGHDGLPTVSGVPEGAYTVLIADDVDLDWYNARGIAFSGATQPCFDANAGSPPVPSAQSTLYVDHTPPTVSAPTVVVADRKALVSATFADALSGVRSVTWSTGDGASFHDVSFYQWSYLTYGTWTGSVTATDLAGNQTTRAFTVALPAPARASVPYPPAPAPVTLRDTAAPRVTLLRAARAVLRTRSLALTVAVSERAVAAVSATVTLAGRRYRFAALTHALGPENSFVARLHAPPALRSALRRALRRHRHPRAGVTVRATDATGNVRVLNTSVPLDG
jgi:hypothetical protein